jgi:aldehyde:ferredoxin oxidoreductase
VQAVDGGKVLYVDLSARRVEVRPLDEAYRRAYVGGVGLASRLLWDECPPRIDAFESRNPLVFATGAFTGTNVPASSKYAVATKSPLTGFVGDSLSSSGWALTLRRAGYAALVVTGRSPDPVYLLVDDERVYFRNAESLLGKTCFETEAEIRQKEADGSVAVASIGIAGERLVRYACIANDYGRQAGRTGTGAVMGSKNLKAIAVRGTQAISVAEPLALGERCLALAKRAQESGTEKYRGLGTAGNVLSLDRLAALPTRNYRQSTFEGAEGVSGEVLHDRYLAKVVACAGCPIACDHYYRVVEGRYAGTETSLDYESLYALGPLCGVGDAPAVLKAAEVCDAHGLDTMSTGVSIAWAMECFEKGILTTADTDGIDLRFGNGDAVVALVDLIARREGIGKLLGEGVKRASAEVGQGSEHFAMHVKGLELPGYEPRSLKTLALGLAVATRGACHNRSAAYEHDMSSKVDRFSADAGRGALAMSSEDFAATLDSLGICKFLRKTFRDFFADTAELYRLATGRAVSADDFRLLGERVSNLKKAFNIREGWTRADDWLPPRILEDELPTGVAAGQRVTPAELTLMIDSYYGARGWTSDGLIPDEKLVELGMGDLLVTAGG